MSPVLSEDHTGKVINIIMFLDFKKPLIYVFEDCFILNKNSRPDRESNTEYNRDRVVL